MQTENRLVAARRRNAQRGSALLIVLVFAAIVAIMLYRELPVAAFEAQRQKEQLLISRGNEYKRGVKLFVRKIGRFPSSMEELENTNRMRFLRHRYVDPLTGKDDWRLIHAGPGGVIIDSKVQNKSTQGGSTLGQPAAFAGFNNSFSGDVAAIGDAQPASAALRQRAPATKNAASVEQDPLAIPPLGADSNGTDQNSSGAAKVFNSQPSFNPATGQAYTDNQGAGAQGDPNAPPANGAGADANSGNAMAQQLNNVNPKTPEQAQPPQNGTLGNTASFGAQTGAVNGSNPTQGVANNGQIMGAGGIAGVASKASGKSIKTVNDQSKYGLWEFYYDLRKDQNSGASGLQQGVNGANANGSVNNNNGAGNSGSAFGGSSIGGFNNTTNSFGQQPTSGTGQQSGQGSSGFGGTTPAPPPQPQQQQ